MQKTLYLAIGLPGSGKSTAARELQDALGTHQVKVVCRDDLRAMLDQSEWSRLNEKLVLEVEESAIRHALRRDFSVIVADTNFSTSIRTRWGQVALQADALLDDYTLDMRHIPLEVCLERNALREGVERVPDRVIRDMWETFLENSAERLANREPA